MRFIALLLVLITFIFQAPAQLPAPLQVQQKLRVYFNRNVEFLGFAYFIGYEGLNSETKEVEVDGKKMLEKDWQNYGYHFYQRYQTFANSKHMAAALVVAERLWLSDIIPLLLQVDDFPHAHIKDGIQVGHYSNFSESKDSADARRQANTFLEACNALYEEINFDAYLTASAAYYEAALKQVVTQLPDTGFIPALESFYRKKMDSYVLIPSLTIPKGMGFGPRFSSNGISRVFNVFGAYSQQTFIQTDNPDMGFDNKDKLSELSVHEFGHSFVNPVFYQIAVNKADSSAGLFKEIKTVMEAQGYNTWSSCLIEHFVRAGEVIMVEKLRGKAAADKLKEVYINERKFIYLPLIINELRLYEKNQKDTYLAVMERVLKQLK